MSAPIEPSAEIRNMAHACREMYLALVEKGFTEEQAFRFVLSMLPRPSSEQGSQ